MPNARSKLKDILDADLCVGCGLCEGVTGHTVKMAFNNQGFLRPDAVAANEGDAASIVQACPGHKLNLPETSVDTDVIWGPLVKCRTGYAADEQLRHLGSSGGGLSALIASLLETGFANSVTHITADVDNPIHNKLIESTDLSSIKAAAGSRYCPSAPLSSLSEIIQGNSRMVLVGKPCDIAGARQYLEQHPSHKDKIVLLVSFMCGGLPSIEGTHQILKQLGMEGKELKSFRFRGEGWPGGVKAEAKDGTIATMSYDDSWGGILRNYTQYRCKICPDAVGQFADIVFADAWYIDQSGMPSFDEAHGQSMILTRTQSGEEACVSAITAGNVCSEPLDVEMMNKMQPYHVKRKRLAFTRMLAFKLMGHKVPSCKNLNVRQAALQAGIWQNIRSVLGTIRRILVKKY